jgi:uncharacterized phage-associated protein
MAISVFAAAKYLCKKSGWTLSNLELQKLIYLAHMFYLGKTNGLPLISAKFQAWDYGPVQPDLYHRAKVYGASSIKALYHPSADDPIDSEKQDILDRVLGSFSRKSAAWLVAVTHWEEGAWAKNYIPGRFGIEIPNTDILDEYRKRERNAEQRAATQ